MLSEAVLGAWNSPWKVRNEIQRVLSYPRARLLFWFFGVKWCPGFRLYGVPIIQKFRESEMRFESGLQLRSAVRSNPLGPHRPVILCTWAKGAVLEVGENFSMTGGTICAARRILIGANVAVGANSSIIDTDFHPIAPQDRRDAPDAYESDEVIIGDDVFVGMNSLILKGVTIGKGSVIGGGSVVVKDVAAHSIVAGNPARLVGWVEGELTHK